jgi:uncharacterized membrane protein YqjE
MREDRSSAVAASPHEDADQPTLVEAIERVAQAALEVIDKRIDLIQLELRSAIGRSLAAGALLITALALLLIAWVSSMGAAFVLLRAATGEATAFAALAGLNLVIGATLAALGFKRASARS